MLSPAPADSKAVPILPALAAMIGLQMLTIVALLAPGVMAPRIGIDAATLGLYATAACVVGMLTTFPAGMLVGRAELIRKLKKSPLKRALRVGKLTLAALEPVLGLYRAPEFLPQRLTTLRLLTREPAGMKAQAVRLQPIVQRALGAAYEVRDEPMSSQIGSGALPVDQLPSHGLVVRAVKARRGSLDRLEAALRALPRPVIGRAADKALWLDLRCLEASDEEAFEAQWSELRL